MELRYFRTLLFCTVVSCRAVQSCTNRGSRTWEWTSGGCCWAWGRSTRSQTGLWPWRAPCGSGWPACPPARAAPCAGTATTLPPCSAAPNTSSTHSSKHKTTKDHHPYCTTKIQDPSWDIVDCHHSGFSPVFFPTPGCDQKTCYNVLQFQQLHLIMTKKIEIKMTQIFSQKEILFNKVAEWNRMETDCSDRVKHFGLALTSKIELMEQYSRRDFLLFHLWKRQVKTRRRKLWKLPRSWDSISTTWKWFRWVIASKHEFEDMEHLEW